MPLLMTSWSLAMAPHASAQARPPEVAYESLVREAINEYAAGRFEEARALFRRAHALNPSARTLRGIGMASYELSDYAGALIALTGALEDVRRPLTAELRAETVALRDRASAFVGRLTLLISPPNASVLIDGLAPVALGSTLLLNPGVHSVAVTAPGFTERVESVRVEAGAVLRLEVRLASASQQIIIGRPASLRPRLPPTGNVRPRLPAPAPRPAIAPGSAPTAPRTPRYAPPPSEPTQHGYFAVAPILRLHPGRGGPGFGANAAAGFFIPMTTRGTEHISQLAFLAGLGVGFTHLDGGGSYYVINVAPELGFAYRNGTSKSMVMLGAGWTPGFGVGVLVEDAFVDRDAGVWRELRSMHLELQVRAKRLVLGTGLRILSGPSYWIELLQIGVQL